MVWLNDISPWTFAAFGLGWFGVSGVCALALAKVLARSNDAAENEEQSLLRLETARALAPTPQSYREETADWPHHEPFDGLPGGIAEEDEEYSGRAASGTRFKPVRAGDDQDEAEAKPQLRRIR